MRDISESNNPYRHQNKIDSLVYELNKKFRSAVISFEKNNKRETKDKQYLKSQALLKKYQEDYSWFILDIKTGPIFFIFNRVKDVENLTTQLSELVVTN